MSINSWEVGTGAMSFQVVLIVIKELGDLGLR